MRRFALIVLASTFVACVPATPKYAIKLPDRHATLPNGMRVILLPDPTTELVEVDVRYEVGSNEDPVGRAGLAHLVEHLMFDQRQAGPDKPPLGTVIRGHTLFFNAYTTWDQTHYQNLAKKEELKTILGFEAARLATGCETIDQDTFDREKEVVRNEMRTRVGTPESQLIYTYLSDFYPAGHPYARLQGGDDAQIAAITLPEICKFMQDYYVPERATVVIAGNVVEADAQAAVDATLAALPPKKGAPRREVPDFKPKHATITHEMDLEEPSVLIAWKLPPRFSPKEAAVELGRYSAFGRASFEGAEYDFATRVSPVDLGGAAAPMFGVQVFLRDESKVDDAVAAVFRGAREAHRGWEDGLSFERLRVLLIGQKASEFEELGARTEAFAEYSQFDKSNTFFAGDLARIRALTADQVRDALNDYLSPDKAMIIVIKTKKGAGGRYARAGAGYSSGQDHQDKFPVERSEAAHAIDTPTRTTIIDSAHRFTLANGMKVVLLPSLSSLPLVTANLIFAAGSAVEPPELAGIAELTARSIRAQNDQGTSPFDEVGIQFRGNADADYTEFEMHGLGLYLDIMVKWMERVITEGDYNQEEIELNQRSFELSLKRQATRSRLAFQHTFASALFGADHPYAKGGHVTEASFNRIGRDAAVAFKKKHYTARNATLVIAGAFDPALAEKLIRNAFSGWSGDADAPVPTALPKRTGPIYFGVESEDSPIIEVRIAYPTAPGIDDQYAARQVLAEMLTDRVALVREKLGASYGVYAGFAPRVGPGAFVISGPIDAERGGLALAAIRNGIDSLRHGEGFIEDFVRARRKVLQDLVVNANDSVSLTDQLTRIAEYKLEPNFQDQLITNVAHLTPQQVIKLVNTELKPEMEVIGATGTKKAIEKMFLDAGLAGATIIDTAK